MARRDKYYPDDDGRTIADMNVEGMPWYDPSRKNPKPGHPIGNQTKLELTPSQRWRVILGCLSAVAVIMLIFAAVYFIVIFGMDLAWSH